ncbi:hypothetical protein BE61_44500 [Bradyrhizobium elkanii USDA 61]|nr:hypothetical protein BE61_44500 [Bradyrhizobium elkanii USDA 61]
MVQIARTSHYGGKESAYVAWITRGLRLGRVTVAIRRFPATTADGQLLGGVWRYGVAEWLVAIIKQNKVLSLPVAAHSFQFGGG